MGNKRKITVVVISFLFVVLLGALFYFLNSKFHFLADALGGPYVIFQKENFSQVTWDTKPETNEILKDGATISTFAAQSQTEDISFSVRPNQDLGEVQLDVSDLKMGDKVIPKENIEVLNLKVWEQCEGLKKSDGALADKDWYSKCHIPTSTTKDFVPELLVKNNEQNLIEAERNAAPNLSFINPSYYKHNIPEVDQSFSAKLVAGKTHTFYLRIKVPEGAASGNYSGTITFSKKVGSSAVYPSTNLELSLQVLPFSIDYFKEKPAERLIHEKDIISHVEYRVADNIEHAGLNIGEKNYREYLQFLRSAGFTGLIISDYGNIDKVAKMMKELGYSKIIWRAVPYPTGQWLDVNTANTLKAKINQIKAAGFQEVYVYGYDEPGNGQRMFQNIRWAKFVHESGAKVATSLIKQVFDITNSSLLQNEMAGISPEEGKIDLPIYANGNNDSSSSNGYVAGYFDKSWRLPIVNDSPAFQAFTATTIAGIKYVDNQPEYNKKLSKDAWHHIAGVWDGKSNKYSIYVDGKIDYTYDIAPGTLPLGLSLPKNAMRTFIGSTVLDSDASKNPKFEGTSGFRGNIAGVKIYNKALSSLELDSGEVAPRANYDFSDGLNNLTDRTGNYQTCIIDPKNDVRSGRYGPSLLEHNLEPGIFSKNDNPIAGKKSLFFSGNMWALINSISNGVYSSQPETAGSPRLDCGVISDNYGVTDSVTVESWVKLPAEVNSDSTIIGRQEVHNRQYQKIEDYVIGIRKGTQTKLRTNEYYYNQIWPENGNLADRRGFAGFYLQSSGLQGFTPWGLDSPGQYTGDYYDDFDVSDRPKDESHTKTQFSVLPSINNGEFKPVLTYQFEAFRTGVDDSRYMAIYDNLLAKVKTKDAANASIIEKDVKAMLDKYPYTVTKDAEGKVISMSSFNGQPNSYHQANRKLIADKIVEMQNLLNTEITSHVDRFNIEEGQKIKDNPHIISIKVKDISKVSKVEFFIDDNKICTTTLPDVSKSFECPWDTSKYHSIVKVIIYDTVGSKEEVRRNTSVELPANYQSQIITTLPKTGRFYNLLYSILDR